MPPFAPIPVRGGHHHGERLRAADTLLRGFFAGTIKAGAGVLTPGLSDGVGRFAVRFSPQKRALPPIYFFGLLLWRPGLKRRYNCTRIKIT